MATTAFIDVGANTRQMEADISRALNRSYSLSLNTKGFSQPLGKITGQLGEFEKSLEASNARVVAFGASAGAIFAVQKALKATVSAAINVEKRLTDINVILGASSQTLAKFGDSLFTIASETGKSFDEVATAAGELARQGLGVEQTLLRTRDALILTRLTSLDADSSVKALTATINSFSDAALTSTEIINKFAKVDANFAVSSADLANAVSRVGSAAQDAGVSFDELIAIVTAAQQTTARGGSVIGNSFKTIFTRLQRPKVLDELEKLGISVRDLGGNTKPVIQILNGLANSFDDLSSSQKSQISELVGGVFQINILKAALKDLNKEYSIYDKALNDSLTATDEAVKRNEQLNQTLDALINKTLANLTKAGSKLGSDIFGPAIRTTLDGLNKALEFGISEDGTESTGQKIAEGVLKGFGKFLSGPGLALAGVALFKIFGTLTKFSADALKTILTLNTGGQEQRKIQADIARILQTHPEIIQKIYSGELKVDDAANAVLNIYQLQNQVLQRNLDLINRIGQAAATRGIKPISGTSGRASGYIPAFAQEEAMAKSLGATNSVRAKMGKGTIGGKKFVMNNQEVEIPNYGRNGDSAVIPMYAAGTKPIPSTKRTVESLIKGRAGSRTKYTRLQKIKNDNINPKDIINSPKIEIISLENDTKFKELNKKRIETLGQSKGYEQKIEELVKTLNSSSSAVLTSDKNVKVYGKSNAALDVIGRDLLAEVKAGTYSVKKVQEKFLRWPIENPNTSYFSQFSSGIDNIQPIKKLNAKLYTAGKQYETKASGYIPNFESSFLLKNLKQKIDLGIASADDIKLYNEISSSKVGESFSGEKTFSNKFGKAVLAKTGLGGYDISSVNIPAKMRGKGGSYDLYDQMFKHLRESGVKKVGGVLLGQGKGGSQFPFATLKRRLQFGQGTTVELLNGKTVNLKTMEDLMKFSKSVSKKDISAGLDVSTLVAGGYVPNFIDEFHEIPFRIMERGKLRPVGPKDVAAKSRLYELQLLSGGLAKLGFSNPIDLNQIFGQTSEADFLAKKGSIPYLIDAKAGYNDAAQNEIAKKKRTISQLRATQKYKDYIKSLGINDADVRTAIVFGNMQDKQMKTFKKEGLYTRPKDLYTRAHGFVPNFAADKNQKALNDAIGREASARPLSTVRVSKSNAFRNPSNPNGYVVTNTKDEPNGVNSLFAGGYIPNFAAKATGAKPSANNNVDDVDETAGDLNSKMLTLSFVLPQISSQLEQFGGAWGEGSAAVLDNTYKVLGVTTSLETFGGSLGKALKAGGPWIAAASLLGSVGDELYKSFQEGKRSTDELAVSYAKEAENSKKRADDLNTSIQNYRDASEKYKDALFSINPNELNLKKLNDNFQKALLDIPKELRSKVLTASTTDQVNEALNQAAEDAQKQAQNSEALSSAFSNIEKQLDVGFLGEIGNFFGTKASTKRGTEISKSISGLGSKLDVSKINDQQLNTLRKSAITGDFSTFANEFGKAAGYTTDQIRDLALALEDGGEGARSGALDLVKNTTARKKESEQIKKVTELIAQNSQIRAKEAEIAKVKALGGLSIGAAKYAASTDITEIIGDTAKFGALSKTFKAGGGLGNDIVGEMLFKDASKIFGTEGIQKALEVFTKDPAALKGPLAEIFKSQSSIAGRKYDELAKMNSGVDLGSREDFIKAQLDVLSGKDLNTDALLKNNKQLEKLNEELEALRKATLEKAGLPVDGSKAAPASPNQAAGFIPHSNYKNVERLQARRLGAGNVAPILSRGTIGGKKFYLNNKEIEVPGFGKNGDSAVIPTYAKGFVPNFARKKAPKINLKLLDGSHVGMPLNQLRERANIAPIIDFLRSRNIEIADDVGYKTMLGKILSNQGKFKFIFEEAKPFEKLPPIFGEGPMSLPKPIFGEGPMSLPKGFKPKPGFIDDLKGAILKNAGNRSNKDLLKQLVFGGTNENKLIRQVYENAATLGRGASQTPKFRKDLINLLSKNTRGSAFKELAANGLKSYTDFSLKKYLTNGLKPYKNELYGQAGEGGLTKITQGIFRGKFSGVADALTKNRRFGSELTTELTKSGKAIIKPKPSDFKALNWKGSGLIGTLIGLVSRYGINQDAVVRAKNNFLEEQLGIDGGSLGGEILSAAFNLGFDTLSYTNPVTSVARAVGDKLLAETQLESEALDTQMKAVGGTTAQQDVLSTQAQLKRSGIKADEYDAQSQAVINLIESQAANWDELTEEEQQRIIRLRFLASKRRYDDYNNLVSGKNRAGGYIPNFASPLAIAKKTERRLTGSAILGFDSRIGPFVRSANQPSNLDSLIRRDHPEGLSMAMRNSYAVQNGGVPNFAETGAASEEKINQLIEALNNLIENLTNNSSIVGQLSEALSALEDLQGGGAATNNITVAPTIQGVSEEDILAQVTEKLREVLRNPVAAKIALA